MTLNLYPSEIRYSQDNISYKFFNGDLLTSTFARLISGQLHVNSLPLIDCVQKDGNWYAASGNRRLFLYKKLQEAGFLSTITVSIGGDFNVSAFTTECNGLHVDIRWYEIEEPIHEMISQWRRGEEVVAIWGD